MKKQGHIPSASVRFRMPSDTRMTYVHNAYAPSTIYVYINIYIHTSYIHTAAEGWKVQPKHVSGLVLRHLRFARQPMTGRRDASFLAGMLDFSISKYYLASANIIYHQQQLLFSVSIYYY